MQFTPKTEDEIATENLLEVGEYDAEVMDASEQTSKMGNPMLKVKMRVFRPNGGEAYIFDYLLESTAYKLRHFSYAIGLGDQYENGELEADDCKCRTCKVKVAIDKKNPDYPPKNIIRDYVTPDDSESRPTQTPPRSLPKPKHDPDLDQEEDDIPF